MEFSRPEYWSGQPFPSPGDLPNSGTEPRFPTLQADSLPTELSGKPSDRGTHMIETVLRECYKTLPHSDTLQFT